MVSRLPRAVLVVVMLVCPQLAHAQEPKPLTGYRVTSWMEEDGLPPGVIWALGQDKEGFLWIGSDSGLLRFDGARFRTWAELGGAPLPGTAVRALTIAADGTMWLGFGELAAISHLRGRDVETYNGAEGVVDPAVALVQSDDGRMWAATGKGLISFDGRRWSLPPSRDLAAGVIGLTVGPGGAIYAATSNAVYKRTGTSDQFVEIGRTNTVIQALAVDSAGRTWVTDRTTGFRSIGAPLPLGAPSSRGKGYRLLPDRTGDLWVATFGQGVWRVRLNRSGTIAQVQSVTDFQGLSNNVIYALLEDHSGNLWAGTTTGLNRLAPQRLTEIQNLGVVTGIEVTSPGIVWANTADGLIRFSRDGGEWTQSHEPIRRRADVMHTDGSGTLWIADAAGVHRIGAAGPPRLETVTTLLHHVRGITSTPGGIVWMLDTEKGLYQGDASGALTPVATPEIAAGRRIASLFADRDGRLWLGFQGPSGPIAVVFRDGSSRAYSAAEGYAAGYARMFMQDRDGTIWVAGSLGLSRFSGNRFATVRRDTHLPLDSLTSVVEDDEGRLWIGTASGIVRLTKAQFDAALARRWDEVSVATLGATEGVAGTTGWVGQPSATRSADGRLWFLTVTGMTVIDPRSVQETAQRLPVQVDAVGIDDRRFPATAITSIPPRASRLQIEFTVPSLAPAQQTHFRYRLEGFDDAWINSGRLRTAIYTNLPPARYRFLVQMLDATGSWQEPPASWDFSVQPAFYQTAWFIGLCGLAALAVVWSAWRFRVAQVRRQFTIVHGERARLSREIHDTLLQSLAGVALQCDALANAPDHESATKGLLTLRRQVEGYVRECRQSLWNLRSPVLDQHDLPEAIRQVADRVAGSMGVAMDMRVLGTARPSPGRIDDQLLRIGQEAITNAVRHGKPSRLGVALDYSDDAVTLTVEDDGAGFEVNDVMHAHEGHWGLVGMQERARSVNGTVTITSARGQGTLVAVTVPVPRTIDDQAPHSSAVHRGPFNRTRRDRADHQPAA